MANSKVKKYHSEILREIKISASRTTEKQKGWLKNYMGTNKIFYAIKSNAKNKIIKNWTKEHFDISTKEFEDLIGLLCGGKSHEEFTFAGRLLEYMPKLRKQIDIKKLDKWLSNAQGWGEVDSLCQSSFSPEELLEKWTDWKKLLRKLSESKNISKKRASLVLLVKSTRKSANKRIFDIALANIDKLKNEKDILITKAISWLLRSLIKNNKELVENYLKANTDLPAIAAREIKNKLLKGKK